MLYRYVTYYYYKCAKFLVGVIVYPRVRILYIINFVLTKSKNALLRAGQTGGGINSDRGQKTTEACMRNGMVFKSPINECHYDNIAESTVFEKCDPLSAETGNGDPRSIRSRVESPEEALKLETSSRG